MASIGIGDTLQAARLARGEDLATVAEQLKIRRSHVMAMESENFAALGATPYARGHLRNYARYLGLDDVAILNAYDNQFHEVERGAVQEVAQSTAGSTATPREPMPRWIVVTGVMVLLLAGLALIGQLGDSTPEAAPDPGLAVPSVAPTTSDPAGEPSSTPSASAPSTPEATSTPAPSPTPSPTPVVEGVNLFLAFEADCWVRMDIDGAAHPRSQTVIQAGETIELDGDDEVVIRYGNAGGVNVELNGERLGTPGNSGEVVEVTYTPEGVESDA